MVKKHPAYKYAMAAAKGKINAPKYVRKQCQEIVDIVQGKNKQWKFDEKKLELIDGLTDLMQMPPKSLKAGQTVKQAAAGYQWLLWAASLCVVHADKPDKRRFTTVLLEIARKNAKTFDIAVFFILLLLTEPKFSKFYSVAPDGKLSREVREAIKEILSTSPYLTPYFKVMRDQVVCKITESDYIPLNYSNDRLDGKLPSVFLVDEVGALPNSYAVEAMRSGQLTIRNKLGCIISTRYPKLDNPFETEIAYAKRVLDGLDTDETLFALLYEPDNPKDWMTDDSILAHANPLALEIPEIWEDLVKRRTRAVSVEAARENFLCKHCNIPYQGIGVESYVSIADLQKGRLKSIDWRGRDVYLGLDLAMTSDNCAVSMVAQADDGGVLCECVAFVPEDRIEEKNRSERIDYRRFITEGKCYSCGDTIVGYGFIEDYILGIEEKYGVNVIGLGFDRYNALSSAQKLEANGIPCTIVVQHSRHLHPPTKLLAEIIAQGKFYYTHNTLFEINFQNAKCNYDTNMNRFVSKKKSNGKVDMVVATINAMFMLQQEMLEGDFVVQI